MTSPLPLRNVMRSSVLRTLQIAVVLLALVSCAGFVGEHGYLFELTTHFKAFYFVAALALVLSFALLRKWLWLVVAALYAVVNAAYVLPFYVAPHDDDDVAVAGVATPAATLRLLHANVYAGNKDYDALMRLVRLEQPDVFVVQEATRGWLGALEALRETYPHRLVVPNRGEHHIALYSRLSLTEEKAQAASGEPAPPAFILARVTQGERAMTILTIHPPNPPDPARTATRNRDLVFAARLARESAKPFVLIGDLNITMWSPYFAKLKRDGGLRDVRPGFGVLPSWSPKGSLPLIPIDQCLVSSEVFVRNVRTGANIDSDHRPLIVELSF